MPCFLHWSGYLFLYSFQFFCLALCLVFQYYCRSPGSFPAMSFTFIGCSIWKSHFLFSYFFSIWSTPYLSAVILLATALLSLVSFFSILSNFWSHISVAVPLGWVHVCIAGKISWINVCTCGSLIYKVLVVLSIFSVNKALLFLLFLLLSFYS